MADNRTYERLFCCECGDEVKPGDAGLVAPALQPGSNQHSSPRPHVWCQRCAGELEAAEGPAPREHGYYTHAYQLHQFIWSTGEGRNNEELVRFHCDAGWPTTLAQILRELTEAGKIEECGGRRIALCAPWQTPCHEPVVGLATDAPIHEQQPGKRCPHDGAYCHHNCLPGECYRLRAGMSLSTPHEGYPVPDDCASAPPGMMSTPGEQDQVFREATDALPEPEELDKDRYGTDTVHGFALGPDGRVYVSVALEQRLKNIESLLNHLVILDNENERLARIERTLNNILDEHISSRWMPGR